MAKNLVYIGRQPRAKDMVGKLIEKVGGVLRSVGVALDTTGAALQGKAGAQETLLPNTAWLPYKHETGKDAPSAPGYSPTVYSLLSQPGNEASAISAVTPTKGEDVCIAPSAHVIGNVKLGNKSSVWYGAVLRGDVNAIVVGDNTNIQDNVIVHVARNSLHGPRATVIGNNVTVGHGAIIHACTIGDNCLVGMNATIMDGAKVESGSIVGAGATVSPGTVVPAGQIWAGSPARFLRALTAEEASFVASSANNYAALAAEHAAENTKTFEELVVDRQIYKEKVLRGESDIDVHMGIHRDPQTQSILSVS